MVFCAYHAYKEIKDYELLTRIKVMEFNDRASNDRFSVFKFEDRFYELVIIRQPYEHVTTVIYNNPADNTPLGSTSNFRDFEIFKDAGWSLSEINQGFKDEWKDWIKGIFESFEFEHQLFLSTISYYKSLDRMTIKQKIRLEIMEKLMCWLEQYDG